MSLVMVENNKGKKSLTIDGHIYYLEKKQKKVYRWSCSKKKSQFCKGRVSTIVDAGENHHISKPASAHSHDPMASEKTIMAINANLKKNAKTIEKKPCQIIQSSIINCEEQMRIYLPSNNAQNLRIKRVRKNNCSKEPTTIAEISIPETLKFIEGEMFVLVEKSFGENEKIIILGSQSNLKLLGEAKCWLMDGTFKVVPSIMRQLYTIHGKIGSEVVPLVYCIMSSKSKIVYDEFFFELCRISCEWQINLNLERIISDFEIASVSSAKSFFPSAAYKGCLFHFGQIIWRRIQQERLAVKYGNDEKFSMAMRMLKSLAFVPDKDLPK